MATDYLTSTEILAVIRDINSAGQSYSRTGFQYTAASLGELNKMYKEALAREESESETGIVFVDKFPNTSSTDSDW